MVRCERGRCRCWVDGIHLDLVEFGRRGHIIMVAIMVVKAGGIIRKSGAAMAAGGDPL
jgi:hypothetical protein